MSEMHQRSEQEYHLELSNNLFDCKCFISNIFYSKNDSCGWLPGENILTRMWPVSSY